MPINLENELKNGLFILPYTPHDWIIIVLAISGYLFRMYLMYKSSDETNPKIRDWFGVFLLTSICTIGIYELAIYKNIPIQTLFLPFALCIILAKDITDWVFMSKEGKRFVINTLKEIISAILSRFGYEKK